jgi:hypothetical protein
MTDVLPSWRPGATRDALVGFFDAAHDIPPSDRVAVFDNDGTLWCEKPAYPQLSFYVHELADAAQRDADLASRPEYDALLRRDGARIAELGVPRIASALLELFVGLSPEEYSRRARRYFAEAAHPTLARPLRSTVYQPMLELINALRAHDFSVFIVSGGGVEFVRSISLDLYGVPPEGVVGSMIAYEQRTVDGAPALVRSATLDGPANEGIAKVHAIQQHLGRRPILAAGNSPGDREMIEWAVASTGPTLGLLIDHDDDVREMAYESVAGTFHSDERIVDVGRAAGWVVASMRHDWEAVFPS